VYRRLCQSSGAFALGRVVRTKKRISKLGVRIESGVGV